MYLSHHKNAKTAYRYFVDPGKHWRRVDAHRGHSWRKISVYGTRAASLADILLVRRTQMDTANGGIIPFY
jgi:hypothetical protein